MADFAEYLKTSGLSKRKKLLAESEQFTAELLQASKNQSAPVVSGGGSGGTSGGGSIVNSSYSGPMDFSNLAKGKVLPTGARVSQNWGKSRIKYAAGRHTGMDFGGPTGTRVSAAASGIVVAAGSEGAYGNRIKIRHKDGTTTLYGHLSAINVKPGQKVNTGTSIGKIGNTGRSFGSHLHFEVRKVDKYGGDINPRSWFSTR